MSNIRDLNRIDEICDRFEHCWQVGERPAIEDFLEDTLGPHLSSLFTELVLLDMEQRAIIGEVPALSEYVSKYPEFSDVISGLREQYDAAETVQQPVEEARALGKFLLKSRLGRGGFGTVWKAWDRKLSRWVAIKVPRNRIEDADQVSAFVREARTSAGLDHPHIVSVLETDVQDGTPYIVSQLIEGKSLRQRLQAGPLAPRQSAMLCKILADAIGYAHRQGVVHRDLKPGNILLDSAEMPHVTDFGLGCRQLDDATLEPSCEWGGTPSYMSPEQVSSACKPDQLSDIYALGVVLYEMLAGGVPFQGNQAAVFQQILQCEPKPIRRRNRKVPRDLEIICSKAMAKDRRRRYASAEDLAEDLGRFLRSEPITARPVGLIARAWSVTRRNPFVTAMIAVTIVLSGGATTLALQLQTAAVSTGDRPRLVTLYTEPDGARVVFYRLDLAGEPDPQMRSEAPGRSPVKLKLAPGDYLVVAALDDGRFHEVYRRVPPWDETTAVGERDLLWERDSNDSRALRLGLPVPIPALDVVKGMAFVEGAGDAPIGRADSTTEPAHRREIPSFYMDCTEVAVSDARPWLIKGEKLSDVRSYVPVPESYAYAVPYNRAIRLAEKMGKRLPSEFEYEYVATNGGRTRYPWGDGAPNEGQMRLDGVLGPVGEPTFDHAMMEPQIKGLCTNVAEWTSTHESLYPAMTYVHPVSPSIAKAQRVVRGLSGLKPKPLSLAEGEAVYDPRNRTFENRHIYRSNIGFRCVRSARPRLQAEDFVPRAR